MIAMDEKPNKGGNTPHKGNAQTPTMGTDTPATEASMCSTSTFGHSAMSSAMVSTATQPQGGDRLRPVQRRILRVDHEIVIMGLLSAGSFGAFLVFALPLSALVALAVFISSSCTLFYCIYRLVLLEWRNIVQGRGIGDYLPASIFEQLTVTTLNEYMMDSSFFLEYRHLLLYFIPGLTLEQRESYLNRLPPRHRIPLDRPGLGQFFGDDFMRLILGESRWPTRAIEAQAIPIDDTSRRLFEDSDDSSLGLELTDSDLIDDPQESTSAGPSGLSSQTQPAQDIVVTSSRTMPTPPPEDLEQEQEEEGIILEDAVTTMTSTYSTMITNAMTGYAEEAVEYVSPIIIGAGITLSSAATGVGLIGLWLGVYRPSQLSPRSPHFPNTRTLWSTVITGVASASTMVLIRSIARYSMRTQRQESSSKNPDAK